MTGNLTSLFFLLGLILTINIVLRERKSRVLFFFGIFGLIGSFVIFGLRLYDAKGFNILLIDVNRYTIISIWISSILSFVFLGIIVFLKKKSKILLLLQEIFSSLVIALSFIYIFPQILQYTQEFVYFGETTFSTMALLRAVGFGFGILLCIIILFSAKKVSASIKPQLFIFISFVLYAADYTFKALGSMYRLHLIPLTDFVFKVIQIEDNNRNLFMYAQLTLGTIMCIYVLIKHIKVKGEFKNNALFRKAKALYIRRRKWSYSLLIFSFLAVFTVSYLHYIDTKEVELAKPQPFKIEDGKIIIPLKDVSDGKLHRFSYVTPNGYDVRFLAVKKPAGNAYGLGLDACEICGIAGYFERGDDVVCKRCDVVMNKNTIGFKGGCNPIPFPYVIENETIYIETKDLEAEEERFR